MEKLSLRNRLFQTYETGSFEPVFYAVNRKQSPITTMPIMKALLKFKTSRKTKTPINEAKTMDVSLIDETTVTGKTV